MLRGFKDLGALERSMNKSLDREDDGFDSTRQYMDRIASVVSLGAHAVKKGSEVMMDIEEAKDSMDKVTGARPSSEAGATFTPQGPPKVQRVTSQASPGTSELGRKPYGIGSEAAMVVGNNWLPPICLKLGKRETAARESIMHFLKLCSGSGRVTTSFGGRLIAGADTRSYCFNAFRHNLHADTATTTPGAYPSGAKVMDPGGTLYLNFDGFPSDFSNNKVLNDSPIVTMDNGGFYWAPLNLADYEDMSWNLNRLKIARKTYETNPGFADDVQIRDDSVHRLESEIYANNNLLAAAGSSTGSHGNRTYKDAPFKYNMVFKQGSLDYVFMNKGEGPCKVELVVYKIKKRGNATLSSKFSQFSISDSLLSGIKQGYYDKIVARAGTDYLNGRPPVSADCVTNPAHPFLPISRYTTKSEIPFSEVQRVSVILPAGARRPVKIVLGGDKYDPANFTGRTDDASLDRRAILDSHAYVVCIACNGVQSTRQLKAGDNVFANTVYTSDTINIGDMYAPADLQWYMQYTEELEACSYKDPGRSKIFVNGLAPEMNSSIVTLNDIPVDDGSGGTRPKNASELLYSTPVTMIPQDKAVRVPPGQNRIQYGSGGASGTTRGVVDSTPSTTASSGQTTTPKT